MNARPDPGARDANNRLTNWAGTALSYDNNGNLTNDGTRTYTWDTRDRLTALNGGGFTTSYGYDAFNRRSTKTINGVQSGTLYDGYREVHTTTGCTIASTLLNGPGLDERYARTQGTNTHVFLPDALGSTLNLVSPGGSLTASYTYEPYGAATQSGTDDTQYRYTGREDDGTGLMYYRARYYNPRLSRFISEDPIGLEGGYNVYAYVGGRPTNNVDPEGLLDFIAGGHPSINPYVQIGQSHPPMPKEYEPIACFVKPVIDFLNPFGDIFAENAAEGAVESASRSSGAAQDVAEMAGKTVKHLVKKANQVKSIHDAIKEVCECAKKYR